MESGRRTEDAKSLTSEAPASVTLSYDEAIQLSRQILTHHGYSADHADAITRNVVTVQMDDGHSHGLYRLLSCIEMVRQKGVDPQAKPVIVGSEGSLIRVDAQRGNSLLAFEMGLPRLVDRARQQGIAALSIHHAFHFSALWTEVEAIAAEGLVGLAVTPTHPFVAPAGGTKPLLGTNPIAFAWPRPGDFPYAFDFATSMSARGEIELHRRAGESIPPGWGLDAQGQPTTDPTEALAGAQLPFGDYKGSALSTMIELLAGPLIGDHLGHQTRPADGDPETRSDHGELIIALSPQAWLGARTDHYLAEAEKLFAGIEAQGARLPSQRRFAARQRNHEAGGMSIPQALYEDLRALLD